MHRQSFLIRCVLLMLMFSVVLTLENHNNVFQHKITSLKKQHHSNSHSTLRSKQKHLALAHHTEDPEIDVGEAKAKVKDYVLDKLKEWAGTKSVLIEDLVKAYMAADAIKDTTEKVATLIEAFAAGGQAVGEEIPIVSYFFTAVEMWSAMKCMDAWNQPEFEYKPTHEVQHDNKYLGIINGKDTVVNDCDDDTTVALLRIGLGINKLTKTCTNEDYFCVSINNFFG